MARGELEWIAWLEQKLLPMAGRLALGIGDDLAIVNTPRGRVLMGSDMLLDGVHFDSRTQPMRDIGRKCLACALSDCAAMAVRPLAATVSVALSRGMADESVEGLVEGMAALAAEFNCAIAGGDTTLWDQPLAVDVAVVAVEFPGIAAVGRRGARPGDTLCVSGPLGGSLLGRHLTFTPRVAEARRIPERLGGALHAMMDISDGLSLDLHRLCRASGVGARLREPWLESVISDDARRAADQDGRSPLEHALDDGEDFELLAAVGGDAGEAALTPSLAQRALIELGLFPVGVVTEGGIVLEDRQGATWPLEAKGYEHR